MKELMDHLAVLSAPVCEGDQVVTLLGSLPQMYSMLVTVWGVWWWPDYRICATGFEAWGTEARLD